LLEQSTIDAVEQGHMTKDLAILVKNDWNVKEGKDYLITEAYMEKIDQIFQEKWKKVVG